MSPSNQVGISMDKITFSINELAKQTGLSRTKIYQEIAAGRIRIVKVGRRTLVPASAVQAWLDRLSEHPAGG
jgi:excisionase family DNA binding protein